MPNGIAKADLPSKAVRRLRPAVQLAQEMGPRLGRGPLLLRQVPADGRRGHSIGDIRIAMRDRLEEWAWLELAPWRGVGLSP
jgi:hypothetical protein